MAGQIPPPPESYETRTQVIDVNDADCGLNSHDTSSLQALIDRLRAPDDRRWEALDVHRSVWVADTAERDANGLHVRERKVRHEIVPSQGRDSVNRDELTAEPSELVLATG